MLPDRVSNSVPLTYESGALPIATRPGSMFEPLKVDYIETEKSELTVYARTSLPQ